MSIVCLYHGGDLDGICSGAVVKHRYPDAKLFPVHNSQSVIIDDMIKHGDDVFIVDYCLSPFSHMGLVSDHCNLTWIDHHDTTINDYNIFLENDNIDKLKGIRVIGTASCELTWKYLYPNTKVPYSIWLLSRYDVWDHDVSNSILPFQFGMLLNYKEPTNISWWSQLFENDRDADNFQNIIRDGKTIIRYRNRLNSKLCEIQAFESELEGYKCLCINRALCGSTVFDSLWDPDKYDIMIVFYTHGNGTWSVSLYTNANDDKVHVGNIAKQYGGGGHAGAAGFTCKDLPFNINF